MMRNFQLDSLRGIAALLVLFHHWTSWGHDVGLGNIGVQLFFVLSGFLMTGILLDQRNALKNGHARWQQELSTFFSRRAVRILPVMFLTLWLVWLAGNRFVEREDIFWHALFGSNLLFFLRGEFSSSLAHFWSLSVELQFYLFWPFVILFAPRKWLEAIIFIGIVGAPLTRIGLASQGYTNFAQFNVLPFANLDSLGLGSLMALWQRLPTEITQQRQHLFKLVVILAASGLVIFTLVPNFWNAQQTMYAVLFAALVTRAHRSFGGLFGTLLDSKILVFLGTISYGVYVYHVFAPRAVRLALRKLDAPLWLNSAEPLYILSFALTIIVATVSWHLVERPLQVLVRRHSPSAMDKNT